MKAFLVKSTTIRMLTAWFLVILTSWWTINNFLALAKHGQGWTLLAISVVLLLLSALMFPKNHLVGWFVRTVWAKA